MRHLASSPALLTLLGATASAGNSYVITTARRSGREWFVGSVINEPGGELSIPLDFLAPDTGYDVTYYEDAPDSHCVTNREAYRIRQGTVKRGDTIQARRAPGGGHCQSIRPHPQTTQQR